MAWHEEGHAIAGEVVKDGTFWRADLLEAANHLVEVVREVRPQVLVTYDEFGGYGHPDHIQAHRVAMYAASLAAVPSYREDLGEAWDIAKIYWVGLSESRMREGLRHLRAAGDETSFEGMDPDGPMPAFVVPDKYISCIVDGNEFAEAKIRAMKAHATQIEVDGPFFALSNHVGNEVWGFESYRLAKGTRVRSTRTASRRTCSRACEPPRCRRRRRARVVGGPRGPPLGCAPARACRRDLPGGAWLLRGTERPRLAASYSLGLARRLRRRRRGPAGG